jgi:hypothetical protein
MRYGRLNDSPVCTNVTLLVRRVVDITEHVA